MVCLCPTLCHSSPRRAFLLLRSATAVVEAAGAAWRISRPAFESMAAQDPGSLVLLQQIVLRSTSLNAAHALEAFDRIAHAS